MKSYNYSCFVLCLKNITFIYLLIYEKLLYSHFVLCLKNIIFICLLIYEKLLLFTLCFVLEKYNIYIFTDI